MQYSVLGIVQYEMYENCVRVGGAIYKTVSVVKCQCQMSIALICVER